MKKRRDESIKNKEAKTIVTRRSKQGNKNMSNEDK